MELAERVLREVKDVARAQEELNNENINLKGQIAMEENSLNVIKGTTSNHLLKKDNLAKSIESTEGQLRFLESTREANGKSILRQMYLRQSAAKIDPTREEQGAALGHLDEECKRLIASYETNPVYLQVLEAEVTGKQLTQMINDKRTEYMRLEAAELGK